MELEMVVFSSIFSIVERLVVRRAHALGEQLEARLAFVGVDRAQRLAKMEDLSFLPVTLFS
jgi:hypothetical protein